MNLRKVAIVAGGMTLGVALPAAKSMAQTAAAPAGIFEFTNGYTFTNAGPTVEMVMPQVAASYQKADSALTADQAMALAQKDYDSLVDTLENKDPNVTRDMVDVSYLAAKKDELKKVGTELFATAYLTKDTQGVLQTEYRIGVREGR